jgi:hypothetical protein
MIPIFVARHTDDPHRRQSTRKPTPSANERRRIAVVEGPRETMATLTRQQRVFNAVFPPSESPFLTGHVRVGVLRPEQQRAWDTVTTAVYPHFSQLLEERVDIAEGRSSGVRADG